MPRALQFKPVRRRRFYTSRTIAEALRSLMDSGNGARTASTLGVPRGTLSAWKARYLNDDEFAERIDAVLAAAEKQGD